MSKRTYFISTTSNDEIMRQTLRNLMQNVEINTNNIDQIISRFEDRLDSIIKRLENLENKVIDLERKIGAKN